MNTIVSTNANDIHQFMISKGIATSNEVLKLENQLKEKEIKMKEEQFALMGEQLMEYCWHTDNSEDVVSDYMEEAYMKDGLSGLYKILLGMKKDCKEEACHECKEMVENFRPWDYKETNESSS